MNTEAAMESRFPARMFRWAAVYGVIVLTPLYLLPLPARQPEIQLGFVGLALVFQGVFWVIGSNPARYRALMLPAILEKLVFAVPALVSFALGRSNPVVAGFAVIDVLLALGFWRARHVTAA